MCGICVGRRVIDEGQGGENHGEKEKLLSAESSAHARPPFLGLLCACCWLQQCPAPCHQLASLSHAHTIMSNPAGHFWISVADSKWVHLFPTPGPACCHQLCTHSSHGVSLQERRVPAPPPQLLQFLRGRRPWYRTPASSLQPQELPFPSLQPCSIWRHLPYTTSHRLRTVSLLSWTINSYLLSSPLHTHFSVGPP